LSVTDHDSIHSVGSSDSQESSSQESSAPLHVLIIGGGIGGLCLAQGLTKSGISVAVYERDTSARFRNQGYRIGVKDTGARALHDCLPEHLFNLCVATSIRQATRMVFTDEQLHPKFSKPIPRVEPGVSGFGVNRLTLREILLAGLDDVVHFGKTFHHYQQTDSGRVRAYFADGESATADLLVGADGTNSAVRHLLAPDAVIDELHWAVYGRTPVTAGTVDWVPDVLVDTFNRVIGPSDTAFAVATCRPLEPVAGAAARLAPGLRLTDMPDYFSWTMPLIEERLRTADAATLHRAASDMVDGWHPAVRRMVAEADAPATFPVCITSARPVRPWDTANVTLLGDAIHTMSPGRGDGANIALKDARLLRDALVEVVAGRVSLQRAKARYEAEMLGYGFQAVADSLHKPFAPTARARR
jgi:2-polyprenyl-6-methoxyphenol hydroxylase-like FAD-dependent oxidoreductase